MKEKDIVRRLNSISKKITPKDYSFYNKISEEEMKMKKSFKLLVPAMAMIIFAFIGVLFLNKNTHLTSVSIDVNPSIILDIKNNNKIDSCKPLNDDGKQILTGLKLNGVDLNTGLHAIIGSMYKQGFISETKNSILVSVEGQHDENNVKLENDITKYINEILTGYNVSPSVLSQTVESNETIENKANEFNITVGKAKIINEILKTNAKRTFEDLAKLSISELNLILSDQTKNEEEKSYNVTGSANTSEYITKEEAKNIALADAKLKESDLTYIDVEFDFDDGMMIYDVEFKTNKYELEYEINAKNGNVLNKEKDSENDYDDDDVIEEKTKENSTNKSTGTASTKSKEKTTKITSSKALSIALSNAKLKESEVTDKDVEYEYKSKYKKYIYEVSFETRSYEYEYEIDASTGKILNIEKEKND